MPQTVHTTLKINNVPIYAYNKDYKFWVIRLLDTELWFYGAYDDKESADKAAKDISNGFIIETPELENK